VSDARRGTIVKHETVPDPVYNSELMAEFISKLMLDGKKSVAESILYEPQILSRLRRQGAFGYV